jgi:hypothetical protein
MVLGVLERKPGKKRIKIKALAADKNLAEMAAAIVESCIYLHPSRVEEIEQLLIKLRRHMLANGGSASGAGRGAEDDVSRSSQAESTDRERERDRDRDRRGRDGPSRQPSQGAGRRPEGGDNYGRDSPAEDRSASRTPVPPVDNLPPASMNELDDYLEMLYQVSGKSEKEREEGLKLQVGRLAVFTWPLNLTGRVVRVLQEKGTGMILKLCRDVMNLEQLIQNNTVMGALTRVLQEEYKKSVDLSFNILRYTAAFRFAG